MTYKEKKEALEWDVIIWGEALKFWKYQIEKYIKQNSKPISVLEIGSRSGRLSYWIYTKFPGIQVICSDYFWIEENKIEHIKNLNTKDFSITTESVTGLSFKDRTFDIVIFKSVLGGLQDLNRQDKAISEIYRVLKVNGIMLFAENLASTKFHQFLRSYNRFPWRYLSYSEFNTLIEQFTYVQIKTIGFASLFFRRFFFYRLVSWVDIFLSSLITESKRYVIYGVALKKF